MSESEQKPDKYKNARIYKIVCGDLTYIGSTCQSLANRMSNHRTNYRCWKSGKFHYLSVFQVFEVGSPEIILIEAYKCENREELLKRERFFIESMECVNVRLPYSTKEERDEQNRVSSRRFRENRLEQERERAREYHKTKKNAISP